MKKTFLFVLALVLLFASCGPSGTEKKQEELTLKYVELTALYSKTSEHINSSGEDVIPDQLLSRATELGEAVSDFGLQISNQMSEMDDSALDSLLSQLEKCARELKDLNKELGIK